MLWFTQVESSFLSFNKLYIFDRKLLFRVFTTPDILEVFYKL